MLPMLPMPPVPDTPGQMYEMSLTFDRKPRLKKLTCSLINPERKVLFKILAAGCVVTRVEALSRNMTRVHFCKKI